MIVEVKKNKYTVSDISDDEKISIYNFLQGEIDNWCNKNGDTEFSSKILLGGGNVDWNNTPLSALNKSGLSNEEAFKKSGNNAGLLLWNVISEDTKIFETEKNGTEARKYRLIK